MLLDANNSSYANYTHPAYYNTSVHQVLDSASGSKIGDWILTTGSAGSNSGDSDSSADSKILYNTITHETITPNQIAGGGHSSNSVNEKNTQPGTNAFIKLEASF